MSGQKGETLSQGKDLGSPPLYVLLILRQIECIELVISIDTAFLGHNATYPPITSKKEGPNIFTERAQAMSVVHPYYIY